MAFLFSTVVQGSISECLAELTKVAEGFTQLTSSNRDNYGDMALYSGKYTNDLGNYHECKHTTDAKYVLFQILNRPYIVVGFCGPDACSTDDYYQIADNITDLIEAQTVPSQLNFQAHGRKLFENTELLAQADLKIFMSESKADDLKNEFDAGAIVMLIVLGTFLALTLLGTIYDYFKPEKVHYESFMFSVTSWIDDLPIIQKTEPIYFKVLRCFSIGKNLAYWQTSPIHELTSEDNNLRILEGILMLSVGWVVLGQIYLYRVYYTAIDNIDTVLDQYKDLRICIILGALFAPSTCLFISGFLATYIGVKLCVNGFNIMFLYFDKGARYYPTYILVFLSSWALLKHIGVDGPMWYSIEHVHSECYKKWFAYVLLFSNLYKTNETTCMANAWFMSTDFQFFILTPPICWLYVNYNRIYPYMLSFALCVVTVVSSWLIVHNLSILPVVIVGEDGHFFNDYYFKPYCKAAPYFIGTVASLIVFSWYHYIEKDQVFDTFAFTIAKTIFNNRFARYCLYATGTFLVNFLIFIQIPEWGDVSSFDHWSNNENAWFLALSHVGWAFALSCLLLPVMLGRNPMIGRIMKCSIWSPVERLSVGTYMVTCVILSGIAKSQQAAWRFSDINILIDFFSILLIAAGFSLAIFLTIGAPIIQIWKLKTYHKTEEQKLSSQVELSNK